MPDAKNAKDSGIGDIQVDEIDEDEKKGTADLMAFLERLKLSCKSGDDTDDFDDLDGFDSSDNDSLGSDNDCDDSDDDKSEVKYK